MKFSLTTFALAMAIAATAMADPNLTYQTQVALGTDAKQQARLEQVRYQDGNPAARDYRYFTSCKSERNAFEIANDLFVPCNLDGNSSGPNQ